MGTSRNLSWTRGGKTSPAPAALPSAERSLSQTRLDRICHYPAPSRTYFLTFTRWFCRLSTDAETYPTAELKERAYQIGPEIARLERLVSCPPETLPAVEWEQAENRLQRLWGQQRAIADVLRVRSMQERKRSVSAGSRSTSPPSPPTTPESDFPDPFADQ
jgi:hypothetical protein